MPNAFAAPRVNVVAELPAPRESGLMKVAGRASLAPAPNEAMSRVAGGQMPTALNQRLLGGTAGTAIPMGGSAPMPVLPAGTGGTAPSTVAPVAPPVVPVVQAAAPTREVASLPVPAAISPAFPGVQLAEFNALKAQVNAMQAAIGGALEPLKNGLAAVASRVDQLSQEVGQSIALSTNASDSLQVLAKNASNALSDISSKVAALNQAVLALARGETSTFTPRSIKVPVATPSVAAMPSTVGNRFPTGVEESLTGHQGTPRAKLAFYRR